MVSIDNGSTAKEGNTIFVSSKNLTNPSVGKLSNLKPGNSNFIISQISKLIKTHKICASNNTDSHVENRINIKNIRLNIRNIEKIKNSIIKNSTNNCMTSNYHTNIEKEILNNDKNKLFTNNENCRKKKNLKMLTEGFPHAGRTIIKNSEIHLNNIKRINHILSQGKIKSPQLSNKIIHNKITFKVKAFKGNIFKSFLAHPKFSSSIKPMFNEISSNLIKSKFHRTISLRPETSIKNPLSNQNQYDRPLSRYNKESLFTKIESDTNSKFNSDFPIKMMNLQESENIELLPSNWQK